MYAKTGGGQIIPLDLSVRLTDKVLATPPHRRHFLIPFFVSSYSACSTRLCGGLATLGVLLGNVLDLELCRRGKPAVSLRSYNGSSSSSIPIWPKGGNATRRKLGDSGGRMRRERRTRREGLLELLGLVVVLEDEGVQVTLAADLELDLGALAVTLDARGYCFQSLEISIPLFFAIITPRFPLSFDKTRSRRFAGDGGQGRMWENAYKRRPSCGQSQ